tara:strand:+ start:122386 stop:122715 length:330 start_codon:yes stop_codon:yes gene_type:complete
MELEKEGEKEMTKVVSLDELRTRKAIQEKEATFKKYLTSLKTSELQYEANYIINRVKEEDQSEDFYLKGALLMDELAGRINETGMASTIKSFAKQLKEKLEQKTEYILQ